MEILGYTASVLIGISLGLIGGGGSILTVPVLVYLSDWMPYWLQNILFLSSGQAVSSVLSLIVKKDGSILK